MKTKVSKTDKIEMSQRLSLYVKKSGYSALAFGKIVGISNLWRKTKGISAISDYDLLKICSKFHVNQDWIKYGVGEMGDVHLRQSENEASVNNTSITDATTDTNANRVPYYDIDFTCSVKEVYNDESETPTGFVSIPGSLSADFCCRTSGDSMAPLIMRGDIVAMRKVENWDMFIPYNEVYGIVTTNGLRTIKVIRKGSSDGKIILHSYNSEYEDQEIDAYTIVYLYKVMAIARIF